MYPFERMSRRDDYIGNGKRYMKERLKEIQRDCVANQFQNVVLHKIEAHTDIEVELNDSLAETVISD